MSFSFKNSPHIENFCKQLHIGQVIKVEVLQRTAPSQYKISYQGFLLEAASEIDLLSKSVWLKVIQKKPYPLLQLIVEDADSTVDKLLEFATEKELQVPELTPIVTNMLKNSFTQEKQADLYDFICWLSQNNVYHILCKNMIEGIAGRDITTKEFLYLFAEDSSHSLEENTDQQTEISAKLLLSEVDIPSLYLAPFLYDILARKLQIIQKINSMMSPALCQLCLLCIECYLKIFILPVEVTANKQVTGVMNTKHFGQILFVYQPQKKDMAIYFESLLFINNLKKQLLSATHAMDISLRFALQSSIDHNRKRFVSRKV
ncbi:MAG: hypothetical protein FWG20_05775 [Candidatus Cloacimonetes bacterium]|nr:hypothetical protein [Candidatus Cloacimonadota bacterium]